MPYDNVRLSVYKRSELLIRATLDNSQLIESNPAEAEIEWIPTAAETRLIPKGAKARYELEVWMSGYEIVYLLGTITGIGGLNDDIDEVS